MTQANVKLSKFLSLVLRHQPEAIGLTLDAEGWAIVDELLTAFAKAGTTISREQLEEIVATSDKKRFAFSADGQRIRASQGHSVEVDLALSPVTPPEVLFHGTAERNLASIREQGLLRGARQHVHLSVDIPTARSVGARYGRPVVLNVAAAAMHGQGFEFFVSANGVWLTAHVPPEFLCEAPSAGNASVQKKN